MAKNERQPRAVAHCILRRQGRVLLTHIVDPETGEAGWRLPGGGIEWLEGAEAAVRREVPEELGVELASVRRVAVVEAMIRWKGIDEHEIVFLFEATPMDWATLEGDCIAGIEADGRPLDLRWVSPAELVAAGVRFYPESVVPHLFGQRTASNIRAVALCAFRRGGDVLVFEGWDAVKQRRFRRFPGGGIDYGETAEAAVRREMREELDTELVDVQLLGVLENIFEFEGQPGHETVFVFEAGFAEPARYQALDAFLAADDGGWVDVAWVPLAELDDPVVPLVPDSCLALLNR